MKECKDEQGRGMHGAKSGRRQVHISTSLLQRESQRVWFIPVTTNCEMLKDDPSGTLIRNSVSRVFAVGWTCRPPLPGAHPRKAHLPNRPYYWPEQFRHKELLLKVLRVAIISKTPRSQGPGKSQLCKQDLLRVTVSDFSINSLQSVL